MAEGSENVMPLELAFQRELAYRRKVARLQYANICRDLVPLEIQSSNVIPHPIAGPIPNTFPSPQLSGVKLQALTDDTHKFPPLPQHPLEAKNRTDYYFCRICEVSCSSPFCYKQHVKGKRHRSKLQELRLGKTDGGEHSGSSSRKWCQSCKIWCINENSFKAHLVGKKHLATLGNLQLVRKHTGEMAGAYKSETAKRGGSKMAKLQIRCELCDIWCTDEVAFQSHLEGKAHVLQVHKRSRGI